MQMQARTQPRELSVARRAGRWRSRCASSADGAAAPGREPRIDPDVIIVAVRVGPNNSIPAQGNDEGVAARVGAAGLQLADGHR